MNPNLTVKFIDAFQKAVTAEMAAMKAQLGSFEVPLSDPRKEDNPARNGAALWTFRMAVANDKVALNAECDLRYDSGEQLVTVEAIAPGSVTVSCDGRIPLGKETYTLVIYPWFLYEKLNLALEGMRSGEGFFLENALSAFGKSAYCRRDTRLKLDHEGLNASQRAAVQLCGDCSLAFVWGPPGTGKTVTLGHIVSELTARGMRVLVTSTTNAAVDLALTKLAALPHGAAMIEQGLVVRIGQSTGDAPGTSLTDVTGRLNARSQTLLRRLRAREENLKTALVRCADALHTADDMAAPMQTDLFGALPDVSLSAWDLRDVFGRDRAEKVMLLPADKRTGKIRAREARLERAARLCRERITRCLDDLRVQESAVIDRARVVAATMTGMYVSTLMQGQRFDTVIVDEAGMAVLPSLFYCAALGRSGAVMIGDPRQLPPIVQSNDRFVQSAMGRSIFDVTVPDPHNSAITVMLDTQYRMHRAIGDLVSELFYDRRLKNDASVDARGATAECAPFAGDAIVVVDTRGETQCSKRAGTHSRTNESNATLCVGLAREALKSGIETVAIITPYAEQSRLIRLLLAAVRIPSERAVSHTVHRFQGNERDLVIFDTVDGRPFPPGVLLAGSGPNSSARNLVNVSISRARGKLIVVADVAYFRTQAPGSVVTEMLELAARKGRVVSWRDVNRSG